MGLQCEVPSRRFSYDVPPSPATSYSYTTYTTELTSDEDDLNAELRSVYTLCSHQSSTDLTVSDIPGAGRTLGMLYAKWGRALEMKMNLVAHRRGYGPDAVAARIQKTFFRGTLTDKGVEWSVAGKGERRLSASCRKLVKYTSSKNPATQTQALLQIIRQVTLRPQTRPYFRSLNLTTTLQRLAKAKDTCHDPDVAYLSQQALLCIEENELNSLAGQVLQIPVARRLSTSQKYTDLMLRLLEFCRDPRYAFVAKQYMRTALQYQPWRSITSWTNNAFRRELFQYMEFLVQQAIGSAPYDLEGTEKLVMTVLLPRYCPKHFISCGLSSHSHDNESAVMDVMGNLLDLLQSPASKILLPTAAIAAEEIWGLLQNCSCVAS